jgi:Fic family protein
MRVFDYKKMEDTLLPNDIVELLNEIYEYKGRIELFLEQKDDILSSLESTSYIQSIQASNKIEGIYTSEKRLKDIVIDKSSPVDYNEEQIAGYRDALRLILTSFEDINISPNNILYLHKTLYTYTVDSHAGKYKNMDNSIVEITKEGNTQIRFTPLSAYLTPIKMEELCKNYNDNIQNSKTNKLILIFTFILDFLCIHPFIDGNGRINRLLSILLLLSHGFPIGKYISLDKIIVTSKEDYYEALRASSIGWMEGNNNPLPFIGYGLLVILKAYKTFDERAISIVINKKTKFEQIKQTFDNSLGYLSKSKIIELCPNVSITSIESALHQLLKLGYIEKKGSARATEYKKTNITIVGTKES